MQFNCTSRESDKDWDKDLAEDVKGECEGKYGKVLAIKVERDSQVGFVHVSTQPPFSHFDREKSMSNSTTLSSLRKLYKALMDDGLEDDKFPLFSSPTLLCRLTSNRDMLVPSFCGVTKF